MKSQLQVWLGLLVCSSGLAAAQSAPAPASPLKVTLDQDLIRNVSKDGKMVEERVNAPSSVLPGATLIEEVTLRNTSARALANVAISVPISKSTRYLGSVTASNERWTTQFAALCGGKTLAFAAAPLTCTELVGGKTVTREIRPSEYTQVRWVIGSLAAGETLKLSFRVRVN